MIPLRVCWQTSSLPLQAPDYTEQTVSNKELVLGVTSFSMVTDIQQVQIRNTSHDRQVALGVAGPQASQPAEKLENVQFYLTGAPATVQTLMFEWPASGCGLEISMNQGVSWSLFSAINVSLVDGTTISPLGYESDKNTWLTLAGTAISAEAADGELLAYPPLDRATLWLRVRTPVSSGFTGLFQYQLGVSYDVL